MENTKQRTKTEYNEIVAIAESGEVYMLNYVFDHGDGFRGATGTVFVPFYQDYADERNDFERIKEEYGYLWQESVAAGNCEDSLYDFIQGLIETSDGDFFGHDDSSVHLIPDDFKTYYYPECLGFECVGGGRCFSPRFTKWETVLRPDLLELIKQYEND